MARLARVVVLLASVAGCGGDDPPPAEVVVVLQSDLVIPDDTDFVFADIDSGTGGNLSYPLDGRSFPVSFGFGSQGPTPGFSLRVELQKGKDLVVSRTITDIRFVPHRKMMLVVPLLRACVCQGTSCPSVGTPDCDPLRSPALEPFDAAKAPRISTLNRPFISL